MSGAIWLWLLPGLSLAGGGLLLLSGRYGQRIAGPLAIGLAATATGLAALAWDMRPATQLIWLPYFNDNLPLTLSAAAAAGPLTLLVAIMALVIFLYAQGYLGRHEARARFFGFFTVFLGGMLLLVLSNDLLTLLLGWETVGMCSYALIGFWYLETPRVLAASRAYVTTRSADLGFYLATMAAFAGLGSFALQDLATLTTPLRDLVALGLILAALGKSAQLPFTGWLSGAMQGPTPVSALIHAATMVAAGAILLIKTQPLLAATAWGLPTVLWFGIATALVAALIALYQDEIKQVAAASTVSQYGYIFAVLGAGGIAAGSAHLVNHAAFKALLFMGAGVMVHQGLKHFQEMGGLRRIIPLTATMFAVGALSLAALPPLGGFFSKESMVHVVGEVNKPASWLMLVSGFLTASYAARAWFAAFAGPFRNPAAQHVYPPSAWMTAAMLSLTLLIPFLGLLVLPPLAEPWGTALGTEPTPPFPWLRSLIGVALASAALGWIIWRHRKDRLVPMAPLLFPRFAMAAREWFGLIAMLDSLGRGTIVLGQRLDRLDRTEPARHFAAAVRTLASYEARFDLRVISQGIVDRLTRWTQGLAAGSRLTDRKLWEGALGQLTRSLQATATALSHVQSGLLYQYYLWMALGIGILLICAFLILGG